MNKQNNYPFYICGTDNLKQKVQAKKTREINFRSRISNIFQFLVQKIWPTVSRKV